MPVVDRPGEIRMSARRGVDPTYKLAAGCAGLK